MSASSAPPACDVQVDFPFDYAAHLAGERRIGRLPDAAEGARVAVIGAGGSGLAAAYELLRAGCQPVVYEAERSADGPGGRRLGGRMYSRRLDDADSAVVELGCMRFPDSARLLRQYAQRFGLHWEPFRDNYADGVTPLTVLDVDGRQYRAHGITDLHGLLDGFRTVHTRWQEALSRIGLRQIQRDVAARDVGAVRRRWQEIVDRYELWSFYRFLRDPGGVGLTHDEARIFGTAGVGPAAWDCFFDLAVLEILRLVLCSEPSTQFCAREGISRLAEGFWAQRTTNPQGRSTSLEEVNGGALRPAVVALDVEPDASRGVVVHTADGHQERFAAAIFTPQLHLLETGVDVRVSGPGGTASARTPHAPGDPPPALLAVRQDGPGGGPAVLAGHHARRRDTHRPVAACRLHPRLRPRTRAGRPKRCAVPQLQLGPGCHEDLGVGPGGQSGSVHTGLGGHPPRSPRTSCAGKHVRGRRSRSPGRMNGTSEACAGSPGLAITSTSVTCSPTS